MAWSLDSDDFKGSFCNEGKYPLLTALNKALDSETVVEEKFEQPEVVSGLLAANLVNKIREIVML